MKLAGKSLFMMIITGALIMAGISGCGKQGDITGTGGSASADVIPDPVPEEELAMELDENNWIFDYYDAVTGTDGYDRYDEMVLYERTSGDGLILASYGRSGDGKETRRMILVPQSVYDDCMAVVKQYKMTKWKDGIAIDGAYYVVKFKDGGSKDGAVTRITSDDMPEDGTKAFGAVSVALDTAWSTYCPSEQ